MTQLEAEEILSGIFGVLGHQLGDIKLVRESLKKMIEYEPYWRHMEGLIPGIESIYNKKRQS